MDLDDEDLFVKSKYNPEIAASLGRNEIAPEMNTPVDLIIVNPQVLSDQI